MKDVTGFRSFHPHLFHRGGSGGDDVYSGCDAAYVEARAAVRCRWWRSGLLQRLSVAREFGDKAAERRAHTNLGNAHIFIGEFEIAADQYR